MTQPLALVRNDDQAAHRAAGHPERPDRVAAILRNIESDPDLSRLPWLEVPAIDPSLPLLVHQDREVDRVQRMAESGGGWFDADTYCTADSHRVALHAATCSARAAEAIAADAFASVFALVRPPGHHATPTTPMGFCLFDNAAIAVRIAQRRGLQRVAILDIDVHHGNGTQDIFWDDPTVLYTSLHQYPFYPGTGSASERGGPNAVGLTVNVPLPAGTGAGDWLEAFDGEVTPAVERFRPDLVLVSAGFDAHQDDPLAELRLHDETYGEIARRALTLASGTARGRTLWLLEGGYDLRAIAASAAECLHVLRG